MKALTWDGQVHYHAGPDDQAVIVQKDGGTFKWFEACDRCDAVVVVEANPGTTGMAVKYKVADETQAAAILLQHMAQRGPSLLRVYRDMLESLAAGPPDGTKLMAWIRYQVGFTRQVLYNEKIDVDDDKLPGHPFEKPCDC